MTSSTAPTVIRVKHVHEIPKMPHWAIITNESVIVPGYDQGDPTETQHMTTYTAYLNRDEWEEEVKNQTLAQRMAPAFVAICVEVPTVTTTVEVKIK